MLPPGEKVSVFLWPSLLKQKYNQNTCFIGKLLYHDYQDSTLNGSQKGMIVLYNYCIRYMMMDIKLVAFLNVRIEYIFKITIFRPTTIIPAIISNQYLHHSEPYWSARFQQFHNTHAKI